MPTICVVQRGVTIILKWIMTLTFYHYPKSARPTFYPDGEGGSAFGFTPNLSLNFFFGGSLVRLFTVLPPGEGFV